MKKCYTVATFVLVVKLEYKNWNLQERQIFVEKGIIVYVRQSDFCGYQRNNLNYCTRQSTAVSENSGGFFTLYGTASDMCHESALLQARYIAHVHLRMSRRAMVKQEIIIVH